MRPISSRLNPASSTASSPSEDVLVSVSGPGAKSRFEFDIAAVDCEAELSQMHA